MFLRYVHRFRAIAILAVMAMHLDLTWIRGSWSQRLESSLVSNGTVLFVFVSGLLFQHLSRDFSYRRYLRSKALNVFLPYTLMSLPALAFQATRHIGVFASCPRTTSGLGRTALIALITARHMQVPYWFIPLVGVFYLAAPLFIALDRRPRLYATLPLLFANAMLCHRPAELTHVGHAVVYFLPVYLAGMWFSRYRETLLPLLQRHLRAVLLLSALTLAAEVVLLGQGGAVFSRAPYSTEAGLIDLDLPFKLLLCLATLAALARLPDREMPVLDRLAGMTFGLFFVHKYVSDALERVELRVLHADPPGNLWTFSMSLAAVTLVSWVLVAAVRRALGRRSRLVIGC